MTRDIEFRGKRTDNGKWVYGYLCFIYVDVDKANIYDPKAVRSYDVDLKSVGQYTGLQDKDKKKIYEGDIIKAIHRRDDCKDDREDYFQTFNITFLNGCYMLGNWNAHEFFNNFMFVEVVGNECEKNNLAEVNENG